jgi:hypothetical protein
MAPAGNRKVTGSVEPLLPAISYNTSEPSFARKDHDIMDDDTAHSPATINCRQRRGFGASFALVGLLATVGLLAAACGGGPKDPGAASGGGTTTTVAPTTTTTVASSGSNASGETSQSQQLQLAQCMRSLGVPNFPDPSPGGGQLNAISAAGINTQSPTYQAALQACKKYTPAGEHNAGPECRRERQGTRVLAVHALPRGA